jgi:hypothetical protein
MDNLKHEIKRAIQRGDKHVLEDLLVQARDEHALNFPFDKSCGMTPLMRASAKGSTSCVEIILKFGADVNAISFGGETALMYALMNGKPDIARLLARHRADPTIRNKNGMGIVNIVASVSHKSANLEGIVGECMSIWEESNSKWERRKVGMWLRTDGLTSRNLISVLPLDVSRIIIGYL